MANEAPSADRPNRFRPALPGLLSVLLLSGIGVGVRQYVARRYALAPPPDSLQVRPRVAVGAIRIDPQMKPQTSPAVAERPQESRSDGATFSEPEYWTRYECFVHAERRIEEKLISNFSESFPELSAIYSEKNPRVDAKMVRPVLQRILDTAKNAPADRKPILLLAADAVAERLTFPSVVPPSPELKQQFDELAAQGLTFGWAELDGGWTYQSDLRKLLWKDYSSTESGEDAFVLLLMRGWDTTFCCGQGSDNFRHVLREGEAFLASRPQSPHRLDVAFLLAQAYETWWSLSLTPETGQEEGDPPPAAYREGAAVVREKAIAYYQEVVNTVPDAPEARCSRHALEMLQANQDTHQRRFYCYCD